MKKIFMLRYNTAGIIGAILLATFFMKPFASQAQLAIAFGPKIGLSANSFKGVDADNVESTTTFLGGLFFNLQLGNSFLVQPELLITEKGAVQTKDNVRNDIQVNYFEVPVLAKFRIPLGGIYPHALIGPNFGFQTNAHYTSTNTDDGTTIQTNVGDINKTDVGGLIGAGVDFQSQGSGLFVTADVRYGVSFSNITNNDAETSITMHHTGWIVSAGIGLKFGGKSE